MSLGSGADAQLGGRIISSNFLSRISLMSGKNAGLVSVGSYIPGKILEPMKKAKLIEFLRGTLLPPEYIKAIEETGKMPGYVETNYDGWESQPWFEEWLNRMPKWKLERDPWSGTKQRTRVPHDPESVRR